MPQFNDRLIEKSVLIVNNNRSICRVERVDDIDIERDGHIAAIKDYLVGMVRIVLLVKAGIKIFFTRLSVNIAKRIVDQGRTGKRDDISNGNMPMIAQRIDFDVRISNASADGHADRNAIGTEEIVSAEIAKI